MTRNISEWIWRLVI
jgi:hypothetical protein